MLVVTRRVGEAVVIGREIEVSVVKIGEVAVRLGIDAPAPVPIVRSEQAKHPIRARNDVASPSES